MHAVLCLLMYHIIVKRVTQCDYELSRCGTSRIDNTSVFEYCVVIRKRDVVIVTNATITTVQDEVMTLKSRKLKAE